MELEKIHDGDLELYKKIKTRIAELEKKVEFYEGEIPHRLVRERLEATRLTLRANTEMIHALFGEGCLRQ